MKLSDTLRDYLLWREKEKLRCGWTEMPRWFFVNEAGGFLDESRVRRDFRKALKAAKMSGFRLYDRIRLVNRVPDGSRQSCEIAHRRGGAHEAEGDPTGLVAAGVPVAA